MKRHGFRERGMTMNIVIFVLIIRVSKMLSIKRNLATQKVRKSIFRRQLIQVCLPNLLWPIFFQFFSWSQNHILAHIQFISIYCVFIHNIGAIDNIEPWWFCWCVKGDIQNGWTSDAMQSGTSVFGIFTCISWLYQGISTVSISTSDRTKFHSIWHYPCWKSYSWNACGICSVYGMVIGWSNTISVLFDINIEKRNCIANMVTLHHLDYIVPIGIFVWRNRTHTKYIILWRNKTFHRWNAK